MNLYDCAAPDTKKHRKPLFRCSQKNMWKRIPSSNAAAPDLEERAALRYYLKKKICDKYSSHIFSLPKEKMKPDRKEVTRMTDKRRMLKIQSPNV